MSEEQNNLEAQQPEPAPKPAGPKKAVLGIVAGVLVLGAAYKGFSSYTFGQNHVETDNAYVTGDLVGISPQVGGTLVELKVEDGDFVKKGQLIARLSTDSAEAELAQAEANLQAIQSQVPQAEASLLFQKLSTKAAIDHSKAAITSQESRTLGQKMQVRLTQDTYVNQVKRAQSELAQARAQAAQAKAGIETAKAGLARAKQAVHTADRNAEAAQSSVTASRAEAERASQDLDRYKKLLAGEAISQQQYDSALATATAANANLAGVSQRAAAAASEVALAKASVAQAQAELNAARDFADSVAKQVQVAEASLALAKAGSTQTNIQDAGVRTSESQGSQASADLETAQAGLQQVTVHEKQIATAKAQVEQARAAVANAKVHVKNNFLYAPCDGYVVRHSVNVGTSVNPGQTIVTITRGDKVWVVANYKETQLTNVASGQPVEIVVDAYPGKTFHGKVGSVLQATGSATTLLPPDNATGNFTKVVQRVPVKILLDEDGKSLAQLKQGMSVVATIETSKQEKN